MASDPSGNALNEFPFQAYLNSLYQEYLGEREGELPDYIPELGRVNPDKFGISLVTVDGTIQQVGDTQCDFSIQSISKPFVYGLILEDLGIDGVLKKINTEPSGDAFNSISLEPGTGRPLNPMINAGAIAATSWVRGKSAKDKTDRVLKALSLYAGRSLAIDQKIFRSEKKSGHRNRAIAHMLRNFNIIENDIEPALDLYFQQCSILANASDLAVMAATLANNGVNPVSGIRVIQSEFVPLILSIMSLCGMYDYSGRWIYNIGLPAKSGVGGGIIAVLPGQFGLSVYSPRLDSMGNSVRGTRVCTRFSRDFHLHFLGAAKMAASVIRSSCHLGQIRSRRLRNSEDTLLLDRLGEQCRIFELQGEMQFSSAELVVRKIYKAALESQFILIDFQQVPAMDFASHKLLKSLFSRIDKLKHCRYAISSINMTLKSTFADILEQENPVLAFPDRDHGLEWLENQIIKQKHSLSQNVKASFADNELFQGLSKAQIQILEKNTASAHYEKGDLIIQSGDPAREIFFLLEGEVSIILHKKGDVQQMRISTSSASMCFGELALIGTETRSANVIADTEVSCRILSVEVLNRLGEKDYSLKIRLLENLVRKLAKHLQQNNLEVIALSENRPFA